MFLLLFLITFHTTNGFNMIPIYSEIARKTVESVLSSNNNNTQCLNDLHKVINALYRRDVWALKMLDASAKPNRGYTEINMFHFGNYDECLAVDDGNGIKGKYCLAWLQLIDEETGKPVDPRKNGSTIYEQFGIDPIARRFTAGKQEIFAHLSWALCVPSSCSASDLQPIADNMRKFGSQFVSEIKDFTCRTNEPKPWTKKAIFAIILFTFIGIAMLVSTAYDMLIHQKRATKSNNPLTAFSVYTNTQNLFMVKFSKETFSAINGIRSLSMAWVIVGHTYQHEFFYPNSNTVDVLQFVQKPRNVVLMAGSLSVDSFLCLSGFLLVYSYMNITQNMRKKVPLLIFYLHRFFRLTPALAGTIVIYACLLEYVGDGPQWYHLENVYIANCKNYWWSTLLYIQNYWNSMNECVNQSWYLAVDTQLYVMSPIFLILLSKRPSMGIMALAAGFAFSAALCFGITYWNDLGFLPAEADHIYFLLYYHPTHTRMSVWFVGAGWGYLLFKTLQSRKRLNRNLVRLAWSLTAIAMPTLMLMHVVLIHVPYHPLLAAMFQAFVKPLWACSVCWVMYACIKGYGGLVNEFLSLKIFSVLARVSYSMFLTHLMILILRNAGGRESRQANTGRCLFDAIWVYTLSFLTGVIWTLAFESPAMVIEKCILKSDGDGKRKNRKRIKSRT